MASNTISISKGFLAIAVILVALYANGSAAHSPFCKNCNPGPELDHCESIVQGATTWEEAMINVITTMQKEVKKGKPIMTHVSKFLPGNLLKISKDSIGGTCSEQFQSIEDELNNVLEQIKNGDPMKSIPTELSAVITYLSDCTDALQEFDLDLPQLNTFGDGVHKTASISLAITKLKYNYT